MTVLVMVAIMAATGGPSVKHRRIVHVDASHVRLLRKMHVFWVSIEAGVPYIDIEAPYGSTHIARDAKRILATDVSADDALLVHREALRRLPIMMSAASLAPGTYDGVAVSAEQITLLTHLSTSIDIDGEVDLPLNPKRPYGDMSAFEIDMAHLLGIKSEHLSEAQTKKLYDLHDSLADVLKVWLAHATFATGDYGQNADDSWSLAPTAPDAVVIAELTRPPKPEALIAAITAKDKDEAKRLLECAADPNAQDAQGYTPIMFAMKNDDLAAVQLLLRAGLGVNDRSGKARATPIMIAAIYGAEDIFDYLMKHGAELASSSGMSALGFAVLYQRPAIVAKIEALGWSEPANLGIAGYDGAAQKAAWQRLQVASGAVVANVYLRSTADRLGLQIDDLVVEVEGKPVASFDDIRAVMKSKRYGDEISVVVLRQGARVETRAKAGPKIEAAFFKFEKR